MSPTNETLAQGNASPSARVPAAPTKLTAPSRWHDPLRLIHNEPPSEFGRIVLWGVVVLTGILLVWATFGQLDIIASAEGKLVPQTLLKIVQPAEPGVVKELLVEEGASVKAGQVLARLDTTLANADRAGIGSELDNLQMQARRIAAELADKPMEPTAGDDPGRYAQVHSQYLAHRRAFVDSLEHEQSLLAKGRTRT